MATLHLSPEWQSHNSLLICLKHLFETKVGADVRFFVGEKQDIVMGHRSILVCRSPVFCDILTTQKPDPVLTEWSIKVTNTPKNIFNIFLRYLYTDNVHQEMTEQTAKALIHLAQKYRVNTLVNYCKGVLNRTVSKVHKDTSSKCVDSICISEQNSDNTSHLSKVIDRKPTAIGQVIHSVCDDSMYLVKPSDKTCIRNHSQTSEGVNAQERPGQDQMGLNSATENQTQDNVPDTAPQIRSKFFTVDADDNETMHVKVEIQKEDFDNNTNTSQRSVLENFQVRNHDDNTSQNVVLDSHGVDQSYAGHTLQNVNKSQAQHIKTEIVDESFSPPQVGVVMENLEDGSYQYPGNVSQNDSVIHHIKEELPDEDTMEVENPNVRDYTGCNLEEIDTITKQNAVGEVTPSDRNYTESDEETQKMEIHDDATDTNNDETDMDNTSWQSGDKVQIVRFSKDVFTAGQSPNRETTAMTSPVKSPQPDSQDEEPRPKRFKVASEEELDELFDTRHAISTKKNTQWGMKLFQDWNTEVSGRPLDMAKVSVPDLAELLRKFYYGARPNKRNEDVYHSNTLINIRAAINRHLANIHRTIDIVRDKEFKHANGVLDGLLKQRKRSELSKPTTHKPFIETSDLQKIFSYLERADSSPIILRQCVWFNLSMYFVTRGMEFHQQLTPQSFAFQHDEYGEYVSLTHDIVEENRRSGSKRLLNDKRMYSCPESPSCPVKMLRLLLEKTDPNATQLFNQYNKEACLSPLITNIWYTPKPLSKRTFARFLADICKAAHVDENYTPLCLRATAMQYLNEPGFEPRQRRPSRLNESPLHNNYRSRSSYSRKRQSSSRPEMSSSTSLPRPIALQMAILHPRQVVEPDIMPVSSVTSNSQINMTPSVTLCPHPDSVQVRPFKDS